MLFSRFVKPAAALLLLIIGFAAPAHAQNNMQIISGTWYEDRAVTPVAASSNSVTLTFAQTPTDQFLNITNVSCNINMTSSQTIDAMTLAAGTTSGASDLNRNYEVKGNVAPETSGTTKYYSIVTNQVYFKFGPGRFPSISINTASTGGAPSIFARCVIVGNLMDN